MLALLGTQTTSNAYMSWLSLAQDRLFTTPGRLATIWFDSVLLQLPRADLINNVVDHLVQQGAMDSPTADELLKIWTPASRVLPDYKFLHDPWCADNAELVAETQRITIDATKSEYPEMSVDDPAFRHEIAWAGAGLLDAIKTWCVLNSKQGCNLLADERENTLVDRVFGSPDSSGMNLFSEIAAERIPNLDALSWARVLELRHHPRLEAFRKKMVALQRYARSSGKVVTAGDIADLEIYNLRALARDVQPSAGSAVIKAVATKMPLGLPINPLSVATGIGDITNTFERERRFGWLYFLIDLGDYGP